MEAYDKIFDWYLSARSPDAGVAPVRLLAQKLESNATVLDVGCGHGAPITTSLLEQGFSPYGIDSSRKMVEKFREQCRDVPVQHCGVLDSDFFNTSFDAIVSYGFMFHLPADLQKKVIKKVSEHLKQGGYFLFNSGNEDGDRMAPPDFNGGETFMMSSMSRRNYEKVLLRNSMALIDHYIELEFGCTIYLARKSA